MSLGEKSMEGSPALSVIVPVYDVEPWLRRCVDSILGQTMSDLEVILVDDGSPDGCGPIVDEYAAIDPRVVAIHQENRGLSAARNSGLKAARGKYVGFVDSDDWIKADMFASMVQRMEETGAEVCACGLCWIDERCRLRSRELRLPRTLDSRSFTLELFARPRTIGASVCNKVFLRGKIHALFDESCRMGEDRLFLAENLPFFKRACVVPEALYCVFERSSSMTRGESDRLVLGLDAAQRAIVAVAQLGKDVRNEAEADYLDLCTQYVNNSVQSYWKDLAINFFLDYSTNNLISIVFNKEIQYKLKLMYLFKLLDYKIYSINH